MSRMRRTAGLVIRGTQRYVLSEFPYSIIYAQLDEIVFVLAVAHASRRPGYWLNRLRD